ncbi:MAG TPA: Na+/H+ antiporter subunit B [candidate division Zixibacteria bacterium]|nr:Na+/H+ antiporter subunit B [candidate division Zixibacteria bacterium]
MKSLILQTATRLILTLLLLFSIFLLIRGHHEPGGGFVAGLVASGAFALCAIAYDIEAARRALRIDPIVLTGLGLLTAAGGGIVGILDRQPFLTGRWLVWSTENFGRIAIGTPLLFDAGVYMVVTGVTLTIVFSLMEE